MSVLIPLLLIRGAAVATLGTPSSGGGDLAVMRERDVAGLDLPEILDERIVVELDLLGGLVPTDGPREVVPPLRGVPVVEGQRVLKQLVLLRGPRAGAGAGAAARAQVRGHCV